MKRAVKRTLCICLLLTFGISFAERPLLGPGGFFVPETIVESMLGAQNPHQLTVTLSTTLTRVYQVKIYYNPNTNSCNNPNFTSTGTNIVSIPTGTYITTDTSWTHLSSPGTLYNGALSASHESGYSMKFEFLSLDGGPYTSPCYSGTSGLWLENEATTPATVCTTNGTNCGFNITQPSAWNI